MRQQRKSAKSKVKDLKKVLKEGLQAVQSGLSEVMHFVIPANGRDEGQPEGSWIVDGITMTFEEYREWHIAHGYGDVDRPAMTKESIKPAAQVMAQPVMTPAKVERRIERYDPVPAPSKKPEEIEEEDSWTEEDREQYHREIGQRLIRPFKIG